MNLRFILFSIFFATSSLYAQTVTGQIRLTNRLGSTALTYGLTDSAYVRVTDQDRNLSSTVLDTVSVRLSTPKEPLGEKITLTETGVSSGIFRGWLRFDATGAVAQDGFLQVTKGQKVTASYRDPADDFGNVSTVTGSSFYGLTVVPSGSLQVGSTTTWTQANSPYLLTGDILVPRTSKLVIQPGVEVRFKPVTDDLAGGEDPNRIEIRVEGRLDARGTATDSIRFISNGDVPASGDWYGIVLNYQYSMMGGSSNVNGENRLHVRHAVLSHYIQGVVVKNGGFYAQNYRSEDSVVVRNTRFVYGGSALSIGSAESRPIEFSYNKLVNCGVMDENNSSVGYKSFRFNNVINTTTTALTFKVRLSPTFNGYLGEIYIQDNTFEHTYLDMPGYTYGPQRVWIQRNTMTKCNSSSSGMYVSFNNYYTSGTADSVRYVITDNVIRGQKGNFNTGQGIYLNASQNPVSLQISNNILRANKYGIYVQSEKSSKAKILNNVVDSSYYDGIRLTRVSGKIQGNTITNNGWSSSYWGVYLNSDFNYPGLDSLINNTISGNGNVSSPNSTTTSPTRGGVSINGHTTAVMNNNNFVANNSFDVVNQVAESVVAQQNAKFNYWGPVTTAAIALGANPKNLTRIYDKYDNATFGLINYGGYLNALYPAGTPSSQSALGQIRLTNRLGSTALTYGLTDSAYVRVTDQDRNLSSTVLDTVSVRLSTPKEPLGEKITLTETGVSSGIFRGWLRFDATGAVAQDGFLQVTKGQKVTASYRDPADDFGNVSTVTGSSFYGLTVVPSGSLQVGSTTTWTQANSPYLLTGDILVPRTSKLVIQPGVEVRFKPVTDDLAGGEDPNRIEIRVEGRLDARGTATDSIRFISNGDVPASGDWYGIVLNYQYSMMGGSSNVNGENRLHVRHAVFSHYIQGVVVKNGGFYAQNYRSEDSVVVRNTRFVYGGSALSIGSAESRPIEFSYNKLVNCGVMDENNSSVGYKSFRFNNVINTTTTALTFKVRLSPTFNGYLGEIYIQDNTFEHTYLDMPGYAYGPQRVWIQRNTMTKCNSSSSGMYVSFNNYYTSGTADSVRYVITDNVIRGQKGNFNTGQGIYLNASQNPVSLQISNNILRANKYGIYVQSEKSSKAKILNNVVDSSYYDGIRLTRVSGKIQGNTITNNGWSSSYWGVYLNSDFNYPGLDSLINNTISGNGNVSSPNSTTTSPTRGGVSINGHTTAVMNNNNFVANNSFDVVNQVAESVVAQQNAKFNYWGPVTTAAIALGANPKNLTRIYDKYDNATFGFVNYGQNISSFIGDQLNDTLYYGGDTVRIVTKTGISGNWNNGTTNKNFVKLYNYSGKLKFNYNIGGLALSDSMYVYDLKRIYVSPTGSNANNGRQNKPKSTIQAAIKSADEGDTILVAPGTYSRFIIEGKRLNVFGLDSLNRPVISGYDTARAVEVESRGVVLKHLSLRNGNAPVTRNWNRGGLLYGGFDSLTVRSCDFKDGFASQGGDYYGGGGKVIFINCSFLKNTKNATALPNRGIFFVDNGLWMEMYNSVVDAEDFGSVFMNGFTHHIYNSTIVNLSGNLYTQPWTGHEFKLINSIVTKKAGKTISLTPNLANLWNGWGGPIELRKSRLPQVPTSYTYSSTASITVTACDTLPVYFTNAATGDYRLSNLDEHHNIGDATVRLYRDAKGMSRPDINGKVDLGAFESNAETCTLNRALVTLSKTIRANSLVTLKATGRNITSVVWNTGQTGSTINVYPNQTRWFKATLTDASGCTHVDSIIVDVANVTFRLDLRNQPTVVAGPHLAGTWNNWTANVDSLTQIGSSTIYERTFGLVVGDTIQYKFINGATWSDPHDILPTSCGEGPYGNRKFIVVASATVLPVVHLSSCTQAKPVDPMPLNQPLKCIGVGQVLSAGPQLTNVVWNTGDTTNSITVKTPGTYWFTAKYPHKVVVLDTTVVTNVSSNAIGLGGVVSRYGVSIPVANPNTVALCPGNSVTLSNISTGTSYLWSSGATTSSVTVNSAGTHYSMVQRANGCWDTTSTVTITMNAAPDTAMTVTGPLAFCPGGSVTLTATAGQTYLWSTGSLNQSVTLSQTSTPFAIVSTSNGCIDTTRTVSVTRFADPDTAVSVSGPLEFCPGGSVTLTAAAGQDYLWNTGDTTQSTTISLTGTAYALVTTINGCTDTTASFATTRFAAPDTNVLASDPLAFCPGFSVTLTATAGLSYAWNNGDTAQFVTVSQSGSTFAIVTTSNGCSDTTATFVTTLYPGADTTITASKLTFCASDSSVITAAGGQSYLWNTGDTTQSITVNQTGNYSVTVTTVNGCVGVTDTVSTTVVPDVVLPQILGDLYGWFASGDTVNFSVANTGGYQLTWGIAGGQITAGQGSDTVEVIWGAADSTASIWVVVSNGVCQDSAYLNLVISGMGNVDQVNARAMAFPNPNTGVFTLEWSNIEAQQVVIYNGVGQVVRTQKVHEGSSSIQMDLRGNAAGIYRAVIYGKDGQVTLPVYVRY